ncbi:hypothetical protein IKQ26_09060 [bacterium]|nr:hypothetical protein [bacterium]
MFHKNIVNDFERAKFYFENMSAYLISPYELNVMLKKSMNSFQLIDVRDYEDYLDGHIEFAQHIPPHKIEENLSMLDKTKPTIVYCYNPSCKRAVHAALKLIEHKYPAVILDGGIETWEEFDFETVKTSASDK